LNVVCYWLSLTSLLATAASITITTSLWHLWKALESFCINFRHRRRRLLADWLHTKLSSTVIVYFAFAKKLLR